MCALRIHKWNLHGEFQCAKDELRKFLIGKIRGNGGSRWGAAEGFLADVVFDEAVFEDDAAGALGTDVGVVGDDDDGGVFSVEFVEHFEDGFAGFGVEVAGGFVGKEEDGVVHEGAGDGDALLLAAGEFDGAVVAAVVEADHVAEFAGALAADGGFDALVEEGDFEVFEDGELGDEVKVLEDETEAFAAEFGELVVGELGDVLVVEEVVAAGGAVEAAEDVHEGGLAGAGRAHDGDHVALVDIEGDAGEGADFDGGAGLMVDLGEVSHAGDDGGERCGG
jgi:hypothetical protein